MTLGISIGIGVTQGTGGGAFTPVFLPGLSFWHDAADTATVTLNGSDVASIADKSGNSRSAAQGTAAEQPAYVTGTSGVNSKGTISFTAANNDALNIASALTIGRNKPGISYVGVVRIPTLGAVQRVLSVFSSGAGTALFAVSVAASGALNLISRRVAADTASNLSSTAFVSANTAHFVAASVEYSTGSVKLWIDGTLRTQTAAWTVGSASEDVDASGAPIVGRFSTNTLTGHIGEEMLYSRVLTDQNVADLRALYLKPKWNLA